MLNRKLTIIALILAIMLFGVYSLWGIGRHDQLSVCVLDVGQGECIVMQSPTGKIVLIDCGSTTGRNGGRRAAHAALNYLRSIGKQRIDLLVLTHPHDDHMDGLPELMSRIPVKQVMDTGVPSPENDYCKFLNIINKSNIKYRIANEGLRISLGGGAKMDILNPNTLRQYSDLNENSIVSRVSYGHVSFLLAGDAGETSEEYILSRKRIVRSTVLVVGHHGSNAGTTPQWLASVNPKIAVISVGKRNKYFHPAKEVLLRLSRLKVRVYRTDRSGAVLLNTNGSRLGVHCYGVGQIP